MLGREGTVEMHLNKSRLAALGVQVGHDFLEAVGNAAHGDHDVLCVGRAVVVKQLIIAARQGIDLRHIVLNDAGNRVVVGVDGLAALEGGVGVLHGGTHDRALTVQRALAETVQSFLVHELCQIGKIQHVDLLDLMRGTEAVEEVHKRDT